MGEEGGEGERIPLLLRPLWCLLLVLGLLRADNAEPCPLVSPEPLPTAGSQRSSPPLPSYS